MNTYPIDRTDLEFSQHIELRHIADAAGLARLEVHARPRRRISAPSDWPSKSDLPADSSTWGHGPETWK